MDNMFDVHMHHISKLRGFGVKYWILGIVSEQQATGAMIMNKMQEMSWGRWHPSPGNIYPLLDEMTKSGWLKMTAKEGKKFYTATAKGREQLENSWFPWHEIKRKSAGLGDVEDAIEKLENYSEYLIDNSAEIKKKGKSVERIAAVTRKLGTLSKKR
ncbi:MAG: PadR family transcriptional regulator [Candidatus Micrarchaeaceae archaeon]